MGGGYSSVRSGNELQHWGETNVMALKGRRLDISVTTEAGSYRAVKFAKPTKVLCASIEILLWPRWLDTSARL